MEEPEPHVTAAEMIEAILELLRRFESGEISRAVLQVAHRGGTVQDLASRGAGRRHRQAAAMGQLH